MARVLEEHMNRRQFVVGDSVTVGDFVLAYTLDWANEVHLLEGFPNLQKYLARMYARPHAPLRIAAAFDSINDSASQLVSDTIGAVLRDRRRRQRYSE